MKIQWATQFSLGKWTVIEQSEWMCIKKVSFSVKFRSNTSFFFLIYFIIHTIWSWHLDMFKFANKVSKVYYWEDFFPTMDCTREADELLIVRGHLKVGQVFAMCWCTYHLFRAAVAQEAEEVIYQPDGWWVDPRLLQSACRCILGQVTKPHVAPMHPLRCECT